MSETKRTSITWWVAAAAGLASWIVTALVLAWRTGWVHLLLVAAVFAAVRAIVQSDQEPAG